MACVGGGGSPEGGAPALDSGLALGGVGSQAASPEGVMGSSTEPAILPSYDTFYVRMPGQPMEFDKNAPRGLDYHVLLMPGAQQQYDQPATALFYIEKTFPPGATIPQIGGTCEQETILGGYIHLTCYGEFAGVNGLFIRLVSCERPSLETVKAVVGDSANPLPDFLDQVFLQDKKDLWDLNQCIYVDYVFNGSKAQIRFPVEKDRIYFIAQFPPDYNRKTELYGALRPNDQGIHNTPYGTGPGVNPFLWNGRIVQVIMGFQSPEQDLLTIGLLGLGSPQTRAYLSENTDTQKNFSYLTPAAAIGNAGAILSNIFVPGNEACQPVAIWDPARWEKEIVLFNLLNELRAEGGQCADGTQYPPVPPLDMNPTLTCAARYHSADMFNRDFFSHFNPWGQSPWDRIFILGFEPPLSGGNGDEGNLFTVTGENIAKGIAEPAEVLEAWKNSSNHCANLFSPQYTHVGVAWEPGNGQNFWTLDFGTIW